METLQYLSQAPPTQEDCLSFLIYSSVFIARKAYSSFSEFFPTVVYEWQEQEGCWSVEEQQAFKESHDCFSKIDEMNDVTMYVANLVLFCEESKIFFYFYRILEDIQDLAGWRDGAMQHALHIPTYMKFTSRKVIKMTRKMKHTLTELSALFERAWNNFNLLPLIQKDPKKRSLEIPKEPQRESKATKLPPLDGPGNREVSVESVESQQEGQTINSTSSQPEGEIINSTSSQQEGETITSTSSQQEGQTINAASSSLDNTPIIITSQTSDGSVGAARVEITFANISVII